MPDPAEVSMTARPSILLVEDEWLIAEEFALLLQEAGYQIVGPAPSAAIALDLLGRHRVDVALLDLTLVGETSYRVADTLMTRGIPFAFVTGYQSREIDAAYRIRPCLQKPVKPRSLLAAVRDLLAVA
jgi:CheY-like chemotaxis protein